MQIIFFTIHIKIDDCAEELNQLISLSGYTFSKRKICCLLAVEKSSCRE